MWPAVCIHGICIPIHIITISKLHLQSPCLSSHLKCTHFNFYFSTELPNLSRCLKNTLQSVWGTQGPINYPSSSSSIRLKLPPQQRALILLVDGHWSTSAPTPQQTKFPIAAVIPRMVWAGLIGRFTRKPMRLQLRGLSTCVGPFQSPGRCPKCLYL